MKKTKDFSRLVGIETVVSSLYRVIDQNLEIHFYKKQGNNEVPIGIYKLVDADGTLFNDDSRVTNYIDLAHPNINFENPTEFIDVLIGGMTIGNWDAVKAKYEDRLVFEDGLYNEFKGAEFEERLGEYEQGTGTAKITKRVITYVKQ